MAIAISTSPPNLSMLRKFNVWYSVADGNFNDPNIWISNGKKKHNYPQAGDDVYIDHVVTFNNSNYTLRNIYIQGALIFSSSSLIIKGDLQSNGTIDMSTNATCSLILEGANNYINSFPTPGVNSTMGYNRFGDQSIINLNYNNLIFGGSGIKTITTGLIINGSTTVFGMANVVIKTTSKITFIGLLNSGGGFNSIDNTVNNADMEFRGGILIDPRITVPSLGTGNMYFNGNQQIQIGGGSPYNNYNQIIIMGSSIVTLKSDIGNSSPWIVNGSLNGQSSSSTFNVDGTLWQATPIEPMTTGIYNYNHGSTSQIGYVYNGNYVLPYTSYVSLHIGGTGTKSLSVDTSISKVLDISGNLDLGTNAITVAGNTNLNSGSLTKSNSTGLTKFMGFLNLTGSIFNFSGGCTIEFQNGLGGDIRGFTTFSIASGVLIKFTSNNQTFQLGGGAVIIDADILISGAITMTYITTLGFILNGKINGDNPLSKFINQPGANTRFFKYNNAQEPMQTGILISSDPSIFEYGSLNQDINPTTYYNLTLDGTGTKRLLGNVSVSNTYILTSPATLNSNGFSLTNP
jgi:hypothetical protein